MTIQTDYQNHGFALVPQFLSDPEVNELLPTIEHFHQDWLKNNLDFYQSHAVNSAYLTASDCLSHQQKMQIFQLLASDKVSALLAQLPFNRVAFMNTQLFFDPYNPKQNNYWHRDPQYHLTLEQQQAALSGPEVIHLRIALKDEPGIEVVPASHKNWDTDLELAVRTETNGQHRHNDLPSGVKVPLKRGDLMIFSANMIHRGLYGQDRRGLDLLFCEATAELLSFVEPKCLPSKTIRAQLPNPNIFIINGQSC